MGHRTCYDLHAQKELKRYLSKDISIYNFTSPTIKDPIQYGKDNPRVLGLIIFLNDGMNNSDNDVDDDDDNKFDGGDLVFKQLGQIRIKPKLGRAVLFPTVMNLMDVNHNHHNNEKNQDDGTNIFHKEEEEEEDNNDVNSSNNLKEDNRTLFYHAPVFKGVKYIVSFYFRQKSLL